MHDKELLEKILEKLSEFKTETNNNFKSVNKRLDGIDYELKKLNIVTRYKEEYNNIPT